VVVPAHYHTAEEQLMVATRDVLTGMDGMAEATPCPRLSMMPSKAMHWFTCKSKDDLSDVRDLRRKYDIVWAKPQK